MENLALVATTEGDVFDAAFSFVFPNDHERGPRQLPSLYMGTTLFFAHRHAETVLDMFALIAQGVQRSLAVPTYTLHAVRAESGYGLYGHDFFNRSAFRRSLAKRGMEFAPVPLVTFTGEAFECESWGRFQPAFILMQNPDPNEPGPIEMSRAEVAFALAAYRIGPPEHQEIRKLIDVSRDIRGVSGEDADALMMVVRSSVTSGA